MMTQQLLDRIRELSEGILGSSGKSAERKNTLRSMLVEDPGPRGDPDKILKYGLKQIREAGETLVRTSKKHELELEIVMLDKPKWVDLGNEKFQAVSDRIETDQLAIEVDRRKGETLLRFCDLVEELLKED